jgi:hypothetical protein
MCLLHSLGRIPLFSESSLPVLLPEKKYSRQGKVREYVTRIRPQASTDSQSQSLMLAASGHQLCRCQRSRAPRAGQHQIQAGDSVGLVHLQAVINSG